MRELDITLKALEIDDVRPIIEVLKPDWSISDVQIKTFTEGKTLSYFNTKSRLGIICSVFDGILTSRLSSIKQNFFWNRVLQFEVHCSICSNRIRSSYRDNLQNLITFQGDLGQSTSTVTKICNGYQFIISNINNLNFVTSVCECAFFYCFILNLFLI